MLLNHGLFTFGDTPRQAYERMIDLVDAAEHYLAANSICGRSRAAADAPPPIDRIRIAELRSAISGAAGQPCIVRRHTDAASWAFSQRPDVAEVSQQGVATPDQVIWTKRVPLIGTDVAAYANAYRAYFDRHVAGRSLQMLDPAPRVILDPAMGMLTAGRDAWAQSAAGEIYLQIIDVIEQAEGLGGYRALPASEIFDLEYWELEQLKFERNPHQAEFTGEVAVVTGANSGIGRGCALALLNRGAAVIGLDINPAVTEMTDHIAYLGVACDLSSLDATAAALDQGVERFGGVDMVVAAAGLFPESAPISAHNPTAWRRAMSVNVDGLIQLLSLVHPLLLRAPRGGRLTVIGSKNVEAPGPGASAYSASKAAANQIARVAALEWAPTGSASTRFIQTPSSTRHCGPPSCWPNGPSVTGCRSRSTNAAICWASRSPVPLSAKWSPPRSARCSRRSRVRTYRSMVETNESSDELISVTDPMPSRVPTTTIPDEGKREDRKWTGVWNAGWHRSSHRRPARPSSWPSTTGTSSGRHGCSRTRERRSKS